MKLGKDRHGRSPPGRIWRRGVVGLARQPGSQLPQMIGVAHVAAVRRRFQRQRHSVKPFLIDVPQDGLDKFKPIRRRMFAGPTAQAKQSCAAL